MAYDQITCAGSAPWSWTRPVKQRFTSTRQQRCPICEGRKTVPQGFYHASRGDVFGATSTGREPCQQCGGTGMIPYTETVEVDPDAD
jgi:hypothetical protein